MGVDWSELVDLMSVKQCPVHEADLLQDINSRRYHIPKTSLMPSKSYILESSVG